MMMMMVMTIQTDVVVAGGGDDVVVAVAVDGLDDHVGAVPQHVVLAVARVVTPRRIVDRRPVGVDAQARPGRRVAGPPPPPPTREHRVRAAVAREALDGRFGGAEFGAAEARRPVELDGGEAGTLDHHLPDHATLRHQHLAWWIRNNIIPVSIVVGISLQCSDAVGWAAGSKKIEWWGTGCLLYTSDAADEEDSVDLPVGELNPGLPRDRRGYSPLHTHTHARTHTHTPV